MRGNDAAAPGELCVHDSDCPPGTRFTAPNSAFNMRVCAYKLADGCAAVGHCADLPAKVCASYVPLCGCDGQEVRSGDCMYADGYVGGPTTGAAASMCRDGGTH